ncbi:hypothetical protein FS842_002728, partial [Serendipita sp. 407]
PFPTSARTLRKFKSSIYPTYLSNNNSSSSSSSSGNSTNRGSSNGSGTNITNNDNSSSSGGGSTSAATVVAAPLCVECTFAPARQASLFCGLSCLTLARTRGPCLIDLSSTTTTTTNHQPTYQSIAALFAKSWSHATPVPVVEKIFAIISPDAQVRPYRLYRDQIESKHKFTDKKLRPGNEQPRWHGTLCTCGLTATNSNGILCTSPGCSLCNIIRVSYDISYAGIKWGRYGKGIYSTCTSSKASDYSKNAISSPLKAVLLNEVVIGKGIIMSTDSPGLSGPPAGYDSVLAVPRKRLRRGGPPAGLNYDETIVYRNDAIKPVYLVLYQIDSSSAASTSSVAVNTPSIPQTITPTPTSMPTTDVLQARQAVIVDHGPVSSGTDGGGNPNTSGSSFSLSTSGNSGGSGSTIASAAGSSLSSSSSSFFSSFPSFSSPLYSAAVSTRAPSRLSIRMALFIWLLWVIPLLVSLV